jgi:TIR domain
MAVAAPVLVAEPPSPAPEAEPYRPAGVFISYASEDHDIAKAFYQSLQALGETVFDRIKIFFDSKSIDAADEIRVDIREGLNKSDFLVVLYTGLFKRSHGYTGYELGFFDSLIEDEIKRSGKTTRKIIYLYCEDPPVIGNSVLGIRVGVEVADLAGSRAAYVQKSIQSPDNPDTLARALLDIADRAESRLPPPLLDDRNEADIRRNRRRKAVAEEIIPGLKGKLFDGMSTRVTRHSVEQRLIEFELPKPASDQGYVSIPEDANLTPHSGAFEIFGISQLNDTATWREFRDEVRSRDVLGGSSVLLAIEQAVISAISPAIRLDNDQIFKSSNDQIFRVLVTRQMDYYNGRKVVHVYFIQKLQDSELGNNDTSTILGFINVAAKYRFIFIERDSQLSVESFIFEPDPSKIQNKVRQLIRELLLIEEDSRNLKLDQVAAISMYFGGDPAHLATAKSLQDQWFGARGKLMVSAERILAVAPASAEFGAANAEWLATLKSFRQTSEGINSMVTVQALENLKKSFTPGAPASV